MVTRGIVTLWCVVTLECPSPLCPPPTAVTLFMTTFDPTEDSTLIMVTSHTNFVLQVAPVYATTDANWWIPSF